MIRNWSIIQELNPSTKNKDIKKMCQWLQIIFKTEKSYHVCMQSKCHIFTVTIKERGKQTMRDTINEIYRLKITEDDPQIIDEEEMLEELYDEINEIKELLESIYDQNMSILHNQNDIINDLPNLKDDNIRF